MAKLLLEFEVDDNGAVKVTDQLGKEVKQVGTESDKTSPKTDKLSKSFGGIKVAVLATAAAITAFLAGSVKLAKVAAVAKDTRVAFNNLAASAGLAAGEMLTKMKKATAGTISEFQLMQKVSSAVLLGLPIDRFDDMLAVARGASKATGETMEFMLNSIVTGLGRGSKLMLDNLGILFDVDQANKDYAESLGKTSRELTELERKQAFVNTALDIGIENLEKIGDLGDSDADAMARLSASSDNLGVAIGNKLAPIVAKFSSELADIADNITKILMPAEETNDVLLQQAEALRAVEKGWLNLADANLISAKIRGESTEHLEDQVEAYEFLLADQDAEIARIKGLQDAEAFREAERKKAADAEAEAMASAKAATEAAAALEQFRADQRAANAETDNQTDLDRRAAADERERGLVAEIALEREKATKIAAAQKASLAATIENAVLGKATAKEAAVSAIKTESAKAISGYIAGLFTTFPAPIAAILSLTAGAFIGELFSKAIPAFADGTDFASGGLSLVGERGPELVNLPAGSQVTPAEDSQIGGDVVITLDGETIARVTAPQLVRMSEKKQTTLQAS